MKSLSEHKLNMPKGGGWLLGFAVACVGASVVYTLSNNFSAAIAAAIPIAITMGISLEKKFQRQEELMTPRKMKIMLISLIFGITIFAVLFIIKNI